MKLLVAFAVLLVAVNAEPPRYRTTFLQRREQDVESASYSPSGYRPSGAQFYLPSRQTQQVEEPEPRTVYGPPTEEIPTTTESEISTTEDPTLQPLNSQINEEKVTKPDESVEEQETPRTTSNDQEKPEAVAADKEDKNSKDDEVEELENAPAQVQPKQEGVYYILLSNGQLQKVEYLTTANDVWNMAYSTQLRYENVQPISGPIYTFSPEQQLLQVVF